VGNELFQEKKRRRVKIFDSPLDPYSPLVGESKSLILERGKVNKAEKYAMLNAINK